MIGCSDAILASCVAEADQLGPALRRRPEPARDRAARRRPRVLLPRRPGRCPLRAAPPRPGHRTGAALRRAHPAAQGPRRRGACAGRARPSRRHARGRRWRERAGGRAPRSTRSTSWSATSASPTGSASSLPQPHHLLSTYYRAADVCLVPSRSESFGLVALEAAACGTPVVAAAVGGLRTLVEHGRTGFLVEGRDPADFAAYAARDPRDAGDGRRAVGAAADRPGATPGRPRPPACGGSTATSPPARWSTAAETGPVGSRAMRRRRRRGPRRPRGVASTLARRAAGREPGRGRGRARRGIRASGAGSCGCGARRRTSSPSGSRSRQRTLHYETYVMPAPEENQGALYEHLLRRNRKLYGAAFAIGDEDAVFLVGQLAVAAVDRRRARPDPRLALRLRRAVLPAGDAHRLRLPLPRLSMHLIACSCHLDLGSVTTAGRSRRHPIGEAVSEPTPPPSTRAVAPGRGPAPVADLHDHRHRHPRQHPHRRRPSPTSSTTSTSPTPVPGSSSLPGRCRASCMAPVIGVLADRHGRRAVLVPCLVAFGGFGLLSALAPTLRGAAGPAPPPGDRLGRAHQPRRGAASATTGAASNGPD